MPTVNIKMRKKKIITIKLYPDGSVIKWKARYFGSLIDVLKELKRYFNEITPEMIEE